MEVLTIIGIIGTTIILISFLLNQLGKWSATSPSYDLANTIGSAVLMYYAYLLESWPFLVLNTVWFLVSARDVLKSFR